jgi:glycosyltransferase involved in cell wall biosynthesis
MAHRSRALRSRIGRIVAEAAPDIVHLDTIALAQFQDACGTVPVALTHHNIESQLMARRAEHETSPAARAYVKLQAQRLLRYERRSAHFDLNIVVSEADAVSLRRIAPGAKISVVPNGVDTTYFSPHPGEQMPALIYTGGMNMFANRDAVEWFIESIWPLIKAQLPDVRFLAIGQNPSPQVLRAAADDSSIEAPGFVDDIRPWVSRAAVYVVPLRVGGGTRLKVIDAMAQGKAIVSTSLGAEGIDGEADRHFILADEPEAFASAVVELLRNAAARERLGTAARALAVERYSWHLLGQRLVDAYDETVRTASR